LIILVGSIVADGQPSQRAIDSLARSINENVERQRASQDSFLKKQKRESNPSTSQVPVGTARNKSSKELGRGGYTTVVLVAVVLAIVVLVIAIVRGRKIS
jgi:hypothetical protein